MYDDSYARIHRSNVITTNDSHPPPPILTQKSNDQITKYSLTDVILQSPSLKDTCVSDSKLCQKHEQKQRIKTDQEKTSIRRVQSDVNLLLIHNDSIQSFPINDNRLNKKSKSMFDNLNQIQSINNNQENSPVIEKTEPIGENKSV
jgi:hypothetical protein